ncbi:MAG: DNA-binding protein WhiA [Clostridiales bacterium]|nr:DNA-binding protein WhiA [Clostridiales bacterium]
MSFSSQIKTELCTIDCAPCCKRAEAFGLLLFGRSFSSGRISLLTELECVARKYCESVAAVTGVMPAVHLSRAGKYTVSVDSPEDRKKILAEFGYSGKEVALRINRANISEECCPAAFLRGAFLSCGCVTSPQREYHLEFTVSRIKLCRDLQTLIAETGLMPKSVSRTNNCAVYFKDSEEIEDILGAMGANTAVLELMSIKIYKDVRNRVNRKTNFESANLDRTFNAAMAQRDAIQRITETKGLEFLPDQLREIARLRLENPELSLTELGRMMSPPMTRSSVNRRLAKLEEIALKIK